MSVAPLAQSEFLVIGFDPANASLTVLDSMGYSARNRDDAIKDAQRAAADAQAGGSKMRYVVVRIATEATFPE